MRKIELHPWQRTIVMANPGRFARGLFHSDGYRGVNRVRAHLTDGDHSYEYARYIFTNESRDILWLCGETLDRAIGELRSDLVALAEEVRELRRRLAVTAATPLCPVR